MTPHPAAKSPANFDRRRLLQLLAALLAIFVVAEATVRVADRRLNEPLNYYSPTVQQLVTDLDQLDGRGETIDVVFIGSSLVGLGIDADAFDRSSGKSAFNAGIPAAQTTVMQRWALEEVVPRIQPNLVVIGLSTLEFNSNRLNPTIDRYERQRASSTGVLGDLDRRGGGPTVADRSPPRTASTRDLHQGRHRRPTAVRPFAERSSARRTSPGARGGTRAARCTDQLPGWRS